MTSDERDALRNVLGPLMPPSRALKLGHAERVELDTERATDGAPCAVGGQNISARDLHPARRRLRRDSGGIAVLADLRYLVGEAQIRALLAEVFFHKADRASADGMSSLAVP